MQRLTTYISPLEVFVTGIKIHDQYKLCLIAQLSHSSLPLVVKRIKWQPRLLSTIVGFVHLDSLITYLKMALIA